LTTEERAVVLVVEAPHPADGAAKKDRGGRDDRREPRRVRPSSEHRRPKASFRREEGQERQVEEAVGRGRRDPRIDEVQRREQKHAERDDESGRDAIPRPEQEDRDRKHDYRRGSERYERRRQHGHATLERN